MHSLLFQMHKLSTFFISFQVTFTTLQYTFAGPQQPNIPRFWSDNLLVLYKRLSGLEQEYECHDTAACLAHFHPPTFI